MKDARSQPSKVSRAANNFTRCKLLSSSTTAFSADTARRDKFAPLSGCSKRRVAAPPESRPGQCVELDSRFAPAWARLGRCHRVIGKYIESDPGSDARAVATIGSPYEPKHVAQLLKEGKDQILAAGEAQVDIGGRPFTIRKQFLEDLEQHDPAKTIGNLRKALLILHSPTDSTVDVANATAIFMAAKHPKSFVSLDDADHLLTRAQDAEYAAEVIAAWTSRYLG